MIAQEQSPEVRVQTRNEPPRGEEPFEGVTLHVPPSGMPTVKLARGGVEAPKAVSLIELLGLLDRSLTLDALKLPPYRTTTTPPLPPRTLLLSTTEFPEEEREHVLTAWMPPGRYPFTLRDDNRFTTHSVPLPAIVYRAHWCAKDRRLRSLSLTLAPEFDPDAPAERQLETPLYRYPFSNVYASWNNVMEAACWPTIGREEMSLAELPKKAFHAFLAIPNNADLYGVGTTHSASHRDYRSFLEAVEAEGLNPDWLIPAQLDVSGLHHQQRKKGVL